MIHPKTQNKALHITFLFQITYSKAKDARYWLASKLAKYNNDWNFLSNNKKPTQIIGPIPTYSKMNSKMTRRYFNITMSQEKSFVTF